MRSFIPKLFVIVLVLILFGCVSEKNISSQKKEYVSAQNSIDLNKDGNPDVYSYIFSTVEKDGIKTTRYVSVYAENQFQIQNFNSISDSDLLAIQNNILDFKTDYQKIDDTCSTNLGTLSTACQEPKACSVVCSSNSLKCKKLVDNFGDSLGHAIFLYGKDSEEIKSILRNLLAELPKLKDETDNQKTDFLNNLDKITNKISSINANSIFIEFSLCSPVEYQISKLVEIEDKFAKYSRKPIKYNYRVSIILETSLPNNDLTTLDLNAKDFLPGNLEINENSISSPQQITVNSSNSKIQLEWPSFRSSTQKTMLSYGFSTTRTPDTVLSSFQTPTITLKILNTDFLQPTISLYKTFSGLTNNFHISFAAAFAISLILIFLFYNIILMIIGIVRAKMAHDEASNGIYNAFRKTHVRWKTDIIAAIASLVIGFILMGAIAKPVVNQLSFSESIKYLINDPGGSGATLFLFFGFLLAYITIENRIKIFFLERRYGRKFADEKALFLARGNDLISKLGELKLLVSKLTAENFDVGPEQDFVSSVSVTRLNDLIKKSDQFSKREIEDYLTKVEESLSRLTELKRLSEQNWPIWSDYIGKTLNESDQVYISGLVTIPGSLRTWALKRFVKEHQEYGLTFEGELIRRKEISPEKVAQGMIDKKLLKGVVIIKQNKITLSKLEGGNPTITGALAVRLLTYLHSAVNNIGQHEYNSLAIIGNQFFMVFLKHQTLDALLIMEKDKFKDVMDEWKNKLKNV